MKKINLDIIGLSYSQTQTGAYALVLGERNGKRRLPIIIGGFEAQAIAIELEKMTPSRPLTHDLFKTFANTFDINIKEVIIYNLVEGIFFAKLICEKDGKEVEIDARTSDSIALAVRFSCPISTFEFILASAGILLEDEQQPNDGENDDEDELEDPIEELLQASNKDIKTLPLDELEKYLEEAIAMEDYERASQIRDELKQRKAL
jgi:bifunctional DNase/RNase